MSLVTIYHNPACSNSRDTLALIRAAGIEPVIVEYLRSPPDRRTLQALLEAMQLSPRQLLREKESLVEELNLMDRQLSDDELIGAMLAHPRLINRPIVVTAAGTRLCRPPQRVLELLGGRATG